MSNSLVYEGYAARIEFSSNLNLQSKLTGTGKKRVTVRSRLSYYK